jgi:chromosomal replication initiation ATPase DnaA
MTIWDQVLERLRAGMPSEDFHRWFGATAYASDSGDQITVWVPSEAIRRHLDSNYQEAIARALTDQGRAYTHVRLVVTGFEDDEDETR